MKTTHIKSRGKYVQDENRFKHGENHSQEKENGRRTTTTNKYKKALHCTHCEENGHDEEHCWKPHP